jgi:hypothetical protein
MQRKFADRLHGRSRLFGQGAAGAGDARQHDAAVIYAMTIRQVGPVRPSIRSLKHCTSPLPEQSPPRRGIDTERPGDLRPAFPCNDHAPGIIKLVEREFRRTAHMTPAPPPCLAFVRSEITLRSNPAIAPTIEKTMRPAAVFVSISSMTTERRYPVCGGLRGFAADGALTAQPVDPPHCQRIAFLGPFQNRQQAGTGGPLILKHLPAARSVERMQLWGQGSVHPSKRGRSRFSCRELYAYHFARSSPFIFNDLR